MVELRAGIIGMGVMGMLHAGTLNSLENVKVIAVTELKIFTKCQGL
jgi:predicted dehydrogenase